MGLRVWLTIVPALWLVGCVGIYGNTEKFLNEPAIGQQEVDVLTTYGAPDFATTTGNNQRVLMYKVRDVKYFILVGIYSGHDLMVKFDAQGQVQETKRVPRPKTVSILQPLPWAVSE